MLPLRPIWHPTYASGNPQVDNEHQGLFEVLHSVADALEAGKSPPTVFALLNYLVRECVSHFQSEEALLRSCGFPEIDRHALIHSGLVDKMTALLGRSSGKGIDEMEVVATMLYDAVVLHMLEEDRRFFPFLHLPEQQAA